MSIGATRWLGFERGATVETEESAVPRRGGGQVYPLLGSGDIVHLGMCVCVDACKFKWQGSA